MIRFELIKFHLNFRFNFLFLFFNLTAKSVSDTNILKAFFKGCVEWRKMSLLFNDFWWKLGSCFFGHIGILWEEDCLWFDINQWFLLFLILLFGVANNGLKCSFKDRFSHKTWMKCRNVGGLTIDSDVIIEFESCVCVGRHN